MKIQVQTATYTLKIEATPAEQEFALTMIRELVAPTSAPVEEPTKEPTEEPTEEFTLSAELEAAFDAFDDFDSPTEEFTLPTELHDAFDDFDSPTEATTEEPTEELTEDDEDEDEYTDEAPIETPIKNDDGPACPEVLALLTDYQNRALSATDKDVLGGLLDELVDLLEANPTWNKATSDECDRVYEVAEAYYDEL